MHKANQCHNQCEMNVSCKDLEMQWISVTPKNIRPLLIVNVYRPPQGDYKKCCELLVEAFGKADLKDNTEIYIMGDFNIDYTDTKSPPTKELSFTMKALGLTQVIKSPTRTQFRNGVEKSSLLDMIFTNSDYVKTASTLNLNLSDHLAVLVTRKKVWVKSKKVNFKGRSYKNYNKEAFQDRLSELNWDNFYRLDNPNILWDAIRKAIITIIDPICPMKNFNVPEAREPWVTNEMIEAVRDKDNLLKKAKRNQIRGGLGTC